MVHVYCPFSFNVLELWLSGDTLTYIKQNKSYVPKGINLSQEQKERSGIGED